MYYVLNLNDYGVITQVYPAKRLVLNYNYQTFKYLYKLLLISYSFEIRFLFTKVLKKTFIFVT